MSVHHHQKNSIMKIWLSLTFALLFAPTQLIHAQGRGGGPSAGMDSALARLFGKNFSFSATADMKMLDASRNQTLAMICKMAARDGNLRNDIDLGTASGSSLPAQGMAQMKLMGMDHTINLTRQDQNRVYLIYPGMKSYVEMPISKDTNAVHADPKMTKTALGKETIDGHPCAKAKVTIAGDNGKDQTMIIWEASDLKDFPIQISMDLRNSSMVIHFRDIQLEKPDSKLFDPPTDYTKYTDMGQMMMQMMSKMRGKPAE
jgi:uncharacterized protein DUF4412